MSLSLYPSRIRSNEMLGFIGTILLRIWRRIRLSHPRRFLRISVRTPSRTKRGHCDKGAVDLESAAHANDPSLTRFVWLTTQKLPITIVVVRDAENWTSAVKNVNTTDGQRVLCPREWPAPTKAMRVRSHDA